jgi:hypothetical protein
MVTKESHRRVLRGIQLGQIDDVPEPSGASHVDKPELLRLGTLRGICDEEGPFNSIEGTA